MFIEICFIDVIENNFCFKLFSMLFYVFYEFRVLNVILVVRLVVYIGSGG